MIPLSVFNTSILICLLSEHATLIFPISVTERIVPSRSPELRALLRDWPAATVAIIAIDKVETAIFPASDRIILQSFAVAFELVDVVDVSFDAVSVDAVDSAAELFSVDLDDSAGAPDFFE